MKKIKTLVFDFDGTICDSQNHLLTHVNLFSEQYGYKKIQAEEIEKLRSLTSQQLIQFMGIKFYQLPFLVKKVRKSLEKDNETLQPIQGILSALEALKKEGYNLAILTSNSEENVKIFLKTHQLPYFDFIYSGGSIFGKSKMMKKMLKEKKINPLHMLYVGDETRDIEAAQQSGIPIIAVSWGFHAKTNLESKKPNYLIDHPLQLLELLNTF